MKLYRYGGMQKMNNDKTITYLITVGCYVMAILVDGLLKFVPLDEESGSGNSPWTIIIVGASMLFLVLGICLSVLIKKDEINDEKIKNLFKKREKKVDSKSIVIATAPKNKPAKSLNKKQQAFVDDFNKYEERMKSECLDGDTDIISLYNAEHRPAKILVDYFLKNPNWHETEVENNLKSIFLHNFEGLSYILEKLDPGEISYYSLYEGFVYSQRVYQFAGEEDFYNQEVFTILAAKQIIQDMSEENSDDDPVFYDYKELQSKYKVFLYKILDLPFDIDDYFEYYKDYDKICYDIDYNDLRDFDFYYPYVITNITDIILRAFRWCDEMVQDDDFIHLVKNAYQKYHNIETVIEKLYPLYQEDYDDEICNTYCALEDFALCMFFFTKRIYTNNGYEKLEQLYPEFSKEMGRNEIFKHISKNINKYLTTYHDVVKLYKYREIDNNLHSYFLSYSASLPIAIEERFKNAITKYKLLNNSKGNKVVTIADLDMLSGVDFESFLSHLFIKLGYQTTITPASNDYGVDLIVTKNDETIAIQAKRYSEGNSVGISAIQEAIGGMNFYKTDKAMVITTSSYTQNAQNLAKESGVIIGIGKNLKNA